MFSPQTLNKLNDYVQARARVQRPNGRRLAGHLWYRKVLEDAGLDRPADEYESDMGLDSTDVMLLFSALNRWAEEEFERATMLEKKL